MDTEEIEVCVKTREMEELRKDKKIKKKDDKNISANNNNINPAIIIVNRDKCEHKISNESLNNSVQNNQSINNEIKEDNDKKKKYSVSSMLY